MTLSRETAARLGRAIRNFVVSDVGRRAVALGGMLLALLIGINGLNVVSSYVGRDFMTAVERRDSHAFVSMALAWAGVFVVLTVAAVTQRFCEERLGLLWREWLTRRLVDFYLADRMYLYLQAGDGLANPDQRIAEDVRSFTTTTLSLALIFINGTFTLIAFSGVLWSISRLLFGAAVLYAALGSFAAILLGRPLVRLNYDQSDKEAAFRAALVHVRENAEPIAVVHREPLLLHRLQRLVGALVSNYRRIVGINRNLGFFTTGYNYMIQLIPVVLVAPLFIRGTVEFGVIPQASMAFAYVVGAFSLIVNQFPVLSAYGAVLARLSALLDAAETASAPPSSDITIGEDGTRLAFDDVTLHTARDGRTLVRGLTLEIEPRARLLVDGPRDATACVLRALAGLREPGEGRIVRPPGDAVMILPDRPYLPLGTLRELLSPNGRAGRAIDDEIRMALHALALDQLPERAGGLDVERDWDDFLTLEEQRLVAIARALLVGPRFVALERIQAGVGSERAAHALDALANRGVGYVVLDGDEAPTDRFDAVITIAPDGTWTRKAVASAT